MGGIDYRSARKFLRGTCFDSLSKQMLVYIEKPFILNELVYCELYLVEFKTIFIYVMSKAK